MSEAVRLLKAIIRTVAAIEHVRDAVDTISGIHYRRRPLSTAAPASGAARQKDDNRDTVYDRPIYARRAILVTYFMKLS